MSCFSRHSRSGEVEPDQEEKQDDAELGDAQHGRGRTVDQAEPLRADQRAGEQVAEHGA
jgi:hypothetical protein